MLVMTPWRLSKITLLCDEIVVDISKERRLMYKRWVKARSSKLESKFKHIVVVEVLRITYWLRVLADLPNMADLSREDRLFYTLKEDIEKKWWL